MASTVAASVYFSRDAGGYDDLRRKLIPCFDEFYGTALKLIAEWRPDRHIDVLDIGAGTGLFTSMVFELGGIARLSLLDGSPEMLERAKARFPATATVDYRVGDMASADLGRHDLIISALAIHHLSDPDKAALYARIRRALKPGGLFVNAEQVLGPSPEADARYVRIWHEQIRALGVSEEEIAKAAERMSYDRCASVEAQLGWLRDAGFSDVDCSFKAWRFAVISGRA
jgi:ubiquinone/menaquinone biosynthesis C-methylase UbiE